MERIEVDGHEIEYEWVGRAAGRTIVLLHEGLGCVKMWRDFPGKLSAATGWGVLAYSRWGYGGSSSRPLPWPIDHMEQEGQTGLPDLLSALEVEEHILWGHSDGGSVALVNAGHRRDPRLLGVVSVASHVFGGEPAGLDSIRDAAARFEHGEFRDRLARYHHDVEGAFHGWADTWLHPEFADWTIERYLPGIGVPLLVIQGDDDRYGTLHQARAIAAGVPAPPATLILPGCGHHPHLDQPERVLEATRRFVEELPVTSHQPTVGSDQISRVLASDNS